MWWHLNNHSWSGLWLFNAANWEVLTVFLLVVVLSELVNASDLKHSSVCDQWFSKFNFVAGEVPISNKLLTWLIHIKSLRKSLSSQVHGEGISAIIREVNLSDLDRVVSKEVVPLELEVTTAGVESEHHPVIVQELLLRLNSSTSEFLLQEFQ